MQARCLHCLHPLPVRVGKVVTKGDKTGGIDPDQNQICLLKHQKCRMSAYTTFSIAKYAALGGSGVRFESIGSLKLLLGLASSRVEMQDASRPLASARILHLDAGGSPCIDI